MKNNRMSRFPVILMLAALLLGVLTSCIANTTLVIEGGDEEAEDTLISEENNKGSFEYALNEEGYYEITGFVPNGTEVVSITVPSKINGIEVTSIADQAFYYCTYLKSVTVPDSIKTIGNYAFAGCNYLETVTIPDSVVSIGEGLFAYCTMLTSVRLPAGLDKIPAHMFSGCSSLASFTITDTMTSIGVGAFRDCAALTSVVIPETIASIGAQAFYNCSSLVYFEMKANLVFALVTDDSGNVIYDEDGKATVDTEKSTIGEYMLYRFSPDIEIVYDEDNFGMALYYAHYELDKEPPVLETETSGAVTLAS